MNIWLTRLLMIAAFALLAWASWVLRPPVWAYGAAFAALALVYTNTLLERVPLYLTNHTTWAALTGLLAGEPQTTPAPARPAFIDLGCGIGGLVAHVARRCPEWDVVGVETAPGPYLVAKLRTWGLPNASVRFQSLWRVDLGAFDVAYAFLSPAPMPRLLAKIRAEMRSGALFISNSFWDDAVSYDGVVAVNDARVSQLLFLRAGEHAGDFAKKTGPVTTVIRKRRFP